MAAEEDELIHKVLEKKTNKRKQIIDDDDDDEVNDDSPASTTTEIEADPALFDENDLKCVANYIEEQQTQLILSLLTDDSGKPTNNKEDNNDSDKEDENKEYDYKSLRPSLETMGIGM